MYRYTRVPAADFSNCRRRKFVRLCETETAFGSQNEGICKEMSMNRGRFVMNTDVINI